MADLTETIACVNCGEQAGALAPQCPHCFRNPRRRVIAPEPPTVASTAPAPTRTIVLALPTFERVVLPAGRTLLGRDAAIAEVAAALTAYEDVSRNHAVIVNAPDGFAVTDLSSHGSWIDGERLPTGPGVSVPILPGQILRLGTYCYLRLEES